MKLFLQKRLFTIAAACIGLSLTATAQYCIPAYSTGAAGGDYIDRVVLGAIDNTSGDDGGSGYVDFTALSTDLVAGTSYTISTYNCPVWSEAHEIWIDYDQDGLLEDDEVLGCNIIAAGGMADVTFTVPLSALDGATRMRVMCEFAGPCDFDPCGSYTWGQAEEYTVNISGGGAPIAGCTDPASLNYNPDAVTDDGSCFYGYTISDCTYDPMPTEGTILCLGDDEVSAAVPLGFTFSFYGTTFTDCYVASNGYLSFTPLLGSACCSGQILPSAAYPNSIFFGQEDLDPNTCIDGTISYYSTGTPGDMTFVLNFVGVPHYPGPAGTFNVTTQVQLHESTGEIKIVTTDFASDGGFATMGLNLDGVIAQAVAGRNSEVWSAADECISFLPYGAVVVTCPVPTGLFADGITASAATFHWDNMDASQYTCAIWNISSGGISKRHLPTTSLSASHLAPSTTYAFRVKSSCFDDDLRSDYSDWYYFTTAPGRFGQFEDYNVNLYPNPSNGQFNLELNGFENNVSISILNSVGQVVFEDTYAVNSSLFSQQINLDNAAPGIYQVKIVSGDKASLNSIMISK